MAMIIDDPDRGIFKVRRSSMTDPAVLQQERAEIFNRCWIYVGHESEVAKPGDFHTRDVAGRPLIFCRDQHGRVQAFLNSCPHRGAEVCREDVGSAKRFTCFYHGWTFANSGELIALPGEESYGGGFDRSLMGLVSVPRFEGYRGFWFACFDRETVDLETYLAGSKEYLDLVADQSEAGMEVIGGSQRYSIRANWKLLVENSVDGYHAMTTHATYFVFLKDLGTDLTPGVSGRAVDLGNGHTVIEYKAPWGRPIARWEHIWGEECRPELEEIKAGMVDRFGPERAEMMCDTNRNMLIFPNLVVNDIMAITIRTFTPIAPDYQKVSAWSLAPIGEPAHLRARRLDSFLTFLGPGGFATPDDNEALEVCQRGFATAAELEWSDLSRGATKPTPSATDELQMRVFWRQWDRLLHGEAPAHVRPLRPVASQ